MERRQEVLVLNLESTMTIRRVERSKQLLGWRISLHTSSRTCTGGFCDVSLRTSRRALAVMEAWDGCCPVYRNLLLAPLYIHFHLLTFPSSCHSLEHCPNLQDAGGFGIAKARRVNYALVVDVVRRNIGNPPFLNGCRFRSRKWTCMNG